MPAPLRNVALTAMEVATIERLFPGRLVPGVGHGVLEWMSRAARTVGWREADHLRPLRPAQRRGVGLAAVAGRIGDYARAGATHVAVLAVGDDSRELVDYATFLAREVRPLVP